MKKISIILFLILLVSCTSIIRNQTTQESAMISFTVLPSISNTLVSNETSIPSATSTKANIIVVPTNTSTPVRPPTLTYTPSVTDVYLPFPTPIPNSGLTQNCIPIYDFGDRTVDMQGILILSDYPLRRLSSDQKFDAFDLENGNITSIPQMDVHYYLIPEDDQLGPPWGDYYIQYPLYNISPDQTKFFTIEELDVENGKYKLWIGKWDGTTILEKEWDADWGYLDVSWFNNQKLKVVPPNSDEYPYGTVILYNPYTDQSQVLIPDFSSNLNEYQLIIEYNLQLTYAIYMGGIGPYFILHNLQTKEDIFQSNGYALFYSKPVWNNAGDTVYFTQQDISSGKNESFSVTTEEKSTQLANFMDSSPYIGNLVKYSSLSPDETRMGLYVYAYGDENYYGPSLAILDRASGQLVDTCLFPIDFHWSPDGSQIAVTIPIDNATYFPTQNDLGKKHGNIVILDLETWTGWRMSEDIGAVGWMTDW